jgi:hypothetical protein
MERLFEISCNYALIFLSLYLSKTSLTLDKGKIELVIERPICAFLCVIVSYIVLNILNTPSGEEPIDHP